MGFFTETATTGRPLEFEDLRVAMESAFGRPEPHRCIVHPRGGFCFGCGALYVMEGWPGNVRLATVDEFRKVAGV